MNGESRLVRGRPRLGYRWVAVGVLVGIAAAAGGWLVAHRIAARAPAAADAPSPHVLTAGAARLRVSAPWTPARRPPALPGLHAAPAWTPYAGLATTVSVALLPAQHASLLPAALVQSTQGRLPAAQTARLVGLQALAYRGLRSGDAVLDVYAVPTTRGVLTLVCTAGAAADEAPAWCLNGLEQVTVAGAQPLRPAADTAYRLGAPGILAPLDRRRVDERRRLHAAHRLADQRQAAQALSDAYGAAARALAPLVPAGGAATAVPGALRSAAAAYAGLAGAAAHRDRRAWNRSRGAVTRAETVLNRRVAAAG